MISRTHQKDWCGLIDVVAGGKTFCMGIWGWLILLPHQSVLVEKAIDTSYYKTFYRKQRGRAATLM